MDQLKEQMRSLKIDVKPVINIQGPPGAYKNDSGPPRGAIFIANYRKFINDEVETRYGSEIDVQNLINLFLQMGYSHKVVNGIQDCTKDETIKAMKHFSKQKIHENVDSMVLIVMSHGIFNDDFLTSDGQTMTSRQVYNIFSDENCPALKGKLKYFIFKACRGSKNPRGAMSIGPASGTYSESRRRKDKSMSDVILSYSTIPGYGCFRLPDYGSPFIYMICRVFMDMAWQSEINDLMKEVEERLSKYQRCRFRWINKRRDFYFNPLTIGNNDAQENVQPELKNDIEIFPQEISDKDGKLVQQLPEKHVAGVDEGSGETQMTPSTQTNVFLMNNLVGCDSDMTLLTNLFKSLGYNVIDPISDVTYDKLKEVIQKIKKMDHGKSVFIVYYGDGFDDYIVTSDHYAIHLNELQREFNDTNCPNLRNKPKIFITNLSFYEGEIKHESTNQNELHIRNKHETDSDSEDLVLDGDNEKSTECMHQIPAENDLFLLTVEMEGGRCENGSLLTKALFDVLMGNTSPKPLMKIMGSVSERLYKLQEGATEDYICELQTINFPLDFWINPIESKRTRTPSSDEGYYSISES